MIDLTKLTNEEKNELRVKMGTLPSMNTENDHTEFIKGCSAIRVEMIDWPRNPYKTLGELVTATWGNEEYATKWPALSPEHRFMLVKAVLSGQTLPLPLESISFSFIVRGGTRASFDQLARARIGIVFCSQGVRDNSRLDAGFVIPSELWDDLELVEEIKQHVLQFKKLYKKVLSRGAGSFQSARCVFPMNATHSFKFAANYAALVSLCNQRLQICEMAETVATTIAIRDQVERKFPLLASHLKPGCDKARKCTYHQSYTLSEMFGALYAGCGRWPDPTPYATFNRSCSDYSTIGKEMGVLLPSPADWKEFPTYESLDERDKRMFEEA